MYIYMYIVHFNYSSRWGFRIAIGGKLSLDTRCWIHKSERGAKGGRELESKKHLYCLATGYLAMMAIAFRACSIH